MKNRVTVTIAGRDYTLIAAEEDGYVQKVAAYVDGQINEVIDGTHASITDAAVLAATNITDTLFKEQETLENLRRQLKEALEETTKVSMELSEAKREIFKLQNRK
jgi:cell division protein ZapA